jgi:hypothetical protein
MMEMLTRKEILWDSSSLDKELQATKDCWWKRNQPHPLLVIQWKVITLVTIYVHTTKMDSACYIYILVHTYTLTSIYVCNK